jgi:hypothetical protein
MGPGMPRKTRRLNAASIVAVAVLLVTAALAAVGTHPAEASASAPKMAAASSTTTTPPSTTSTASLYLSNWQDMQALWMAPKLNQNSTATYGPRIAELHYSGNWGVNQINDYTGFFRDETDGVKYDQPQNFAPSAYLDENGVLNGAAQSLSFTTGSDAGGNYITFTLPSLDYWDMAWIDY